MDDLTIETLFLLREVIADGQAPPYITNRAKNLIEQWEQKNEQ